MLPAMGAHEKKQFAVKSGATNYDPSGPNAGRFTWFVLLAAFHLVSITAHAGTSLEPANLSDLAEKVAAVTLPCLVSALAAGFCPAHFAAVCLIVCLNVACITHNALEIPDHRSSQTLPSNV